MLKFVSRNEKIVKALLGSDILKKCVVIHIDHINKVRDQKVYEHGLYALSATNRVAKSTAHNRFDDVNKIASKYLSSAKINVIHDVGVSSGITSLELYNFLKNQNIEYEFYISDRYSQFYYKGKSFCRVYDCDFKLLHFYLFNILADNKVSIKSFFTKSLFYPLYFLVGKAHPLLDELTPISLLHNSVLEKISRGEMIEIEYDIFNTALDNKFDFVRVMNVLNLGYFSESKIIGAIENIKRSLKDNGVLQVGRTTKEKKLNNVSFYRKNGSNLLLLEDYNEGSEIKGIIA